MKKNKNKEIIINSINDEFDNRGIKKYSKKELRNMISLEEFLLKYYNRYGFYISERYACHDIKDNLFYPVYDCYHTLFRGKFDNDIDIVKFIDENRLDFIYIDCSYKDINKDYFRDDIDIFVDMDSDICIHINTLAV